MNLLKCHSPEVQQTASCGDGIFDPVPEEAPSLHWPEMVSKGL